MNAALSIPDSLAFPEPGTPEFDTAIDLARQGVLRIGATSDGWLDWDLNETPHGLLAGRVGTGKTMALSVILFYAKYLPDLYDLYICDPAGAGFGRSAELPNVHVAQSPAEIADAARQVCTRASERRDLRSSDGDSSATVHGPSGEGAKRVLFVFDAIEAVLDSAFDPSIADVLDDLRSYLETIAASAGTTGVHLILATQRPAAQVVYPRLRELLGFRLALGRLHIEDSRLLFYSDQTERQTVSPDIRGRGLAYDPENGYQQTQVMFLPDDTMVCPWEPDRVLLGATQMIRSHLPSLGYTVTDSANADGRPVHSWRRL
ncbi:FtsK/SpoIIIE domain-containing protein [Rhodococcus ruber]|uniref:FtsK/SpoIIIE domain-containing protein n=1 Tax=Rhodococcus ruber TaxID=1830 RepID=UPI001F2DA60F|nr:FtsK/SpoIIIE domain-containing protein [Rhodococcus ruber]MCF8786271.1 hypothetical protein [Rhodococcus ruber]